MYQSDLQKTNLALDTHEAEVWDSASYSIILGQFAVLSDFDLWDNSDFVPKVKC